MKHTTDDFPQWPRVARRRRLILLVLILLPTIAATGYMAQVLPHRGTTPMELAVVLIFALLYGWISIGFWTAMAGCLIRITGREPYRISRIVGPEDADIPEDARTAIIMPIYNEDVQRVFAGIASIHESLARTGQGGRFDFYILSDPGDPDIWVQEEMAWAQIQRRIKDSPCRIYYRQRRSNTKRKSGNVADFCRRWGRNYRYMVVLDADSIMTGNTLVQMIRIMEKRPRIGILQTPPKAVSRDSLIARIQQFANHVYGPMFAAGLNYWQLGDSQFWGHNAAIRIEPFMKHCALPRLSGRPPLGGDILSHDFVESALMRKAGYEVWLACDLEGSYEEMPPTLLDELKRDRRWCQGNMQHMRLLFTRGLYGAHRVLFLSGIMSYVSALLWFLFLAASTVMAVLQEIREPDYFPTGHSLFPDWPVWETQWAFVLMISTTIILFLPKICSILYVAFQQGKSRPFGGWAGLLFSFITEVLVSTLLAPTRMLFHAKFVFMTLLGRQISWEAQQRDAEGTSWREALRFHWTGTVFGLFWGLVVFLVNRSFFWWLSPILISLVLAIPLGVWLGSRQTGQWFRRMGLFLIPEEKSPPPELTALAASSDQSREPADFTRAVVDPVLYSLHLSFFQKWRTPSSAVAERLRGICEKALSLGPLSLDDREKKAVLSDPASMAFLHEKVWQLPDDSLVHQWGIPVCLPPAVP